MNMILNTGNPFCVFEYPSHTIRRPIHSENYITSTDIGQWLRRTLYQKELDETEPNQAALDEDQHGKAGHVGKDHPLIVTKEALRNIRVKLEDVSELPAHHHYTKLLWDAYFSKLCSLW